MKNKNPSSPPPPQGWRYVRKGMRLQEGDRFFTWYSKMMGRKGGLMCREFPVGTPIPFDRLVIRRKQAKVKCDLWRTTWDRKQEKPITETRTVQFTLQGVSWAKEDFRALTCAVRRHASSRYKGWLLNGYRRN